MKTELICWSCVTVLVEFFFFFALIYRFLSSKEQFGVKISTIKNRDNGIGNHLSCGNLLGVKKLTFLFFSFYILSSHSIELCKKKSRFTGKPLPDLEFLIYYALIP